MALINCSECGKEYSDKAPACPNCGCPTSPGGMTPIAAPPEKKSYPKKKSSKGSKLTLALLLALSGFAGVAFVMAALRAHLCNAGFFGFCESILDAKRDDLATDDEYFSFDQEKGSVPLIPAITNEKFWAEAKKIEDQWEAKQKAKAQSDREKKANLAWLFVCKQGIKESLKDPGSYREIKTYWTDKAIEFTATNSFGGRQRYVADCKTGKILQR